MTRLAAIQQATPTPEALTEAREIIDTWTHGQEVARHEPLSVWIDRRRSLVDLIALALTEQAREIERATWEAAFKVECDQCAHNVPILRIHQLHGGDDWEHSGQRPRCDARMLRAAAQGGA